MKPNQKLPIIMTDAGHGGHDPGAVSPDGQSTEADLAWDIKERVREILLRYLPPEHLPDSRTGPDHFLPPYKRAVLAYRLEAHLLSIHLNAGGGRGVEVFTSPGQTPSDPWASLVLSWFRASPKSFPVIRTDPSDGDDDKEAKFAVLTRTLHKAILVEAGFMDNWKDLDNLRDPNHRQAIAQAIAMGTVQHFSLFPLDEDAPPKKDPALVDAPITRAEFDELAKRVTSVERELHSLH